MLSALPWWSLQVPAKLINSKNLTPPTWLHWLASIFLLQRCRRALPQGCRSNTSWKYILNKINMEKHFENIKCKTKQVWKTNGRESILFGTFQVGRLELPSAIISVWYLKQIRPQWQRQNDEDGSVIFGMDCSELCVCLALDFSGLGFSIWLFFPNYVSNIWFYQVRRESRLGRWRHCRGRHESLHRRRVIVVVGVLLREEGSLNGNPRHAAQTWETGAVSNSTLVGAWSGPGPGEV